jgi:hypothetical protein
MVDGVKVDTNRHERINVCNWQQTMGKVKSFFFSSFERQRQFWKRFCELFANVGLRMDSEVPESKSLVEFLLSISSGL